MRDAAVVWLQDVARAVHAQWDLLPFEVRWWLWAASGVVLLLLASYGAHHGFRRLLGYRRMHGQWYDAGEWHQLMQMLHEQQMNNRVLHWREIRALREYRTGRKKGLFDHRYG